jgi:hypothetical protein
MARGRMLSKTLSTSAKVAQLYQSCPKLADWCRALFPLLLAHADDHGRLQGDELTVKLQVDPISPRKLPDFVAALHCLHQVGLITWYQVDDRKVIEIVKFFEHQDLKGHDKRPAKLPACPGPEAMIGRDRRDQESRINTGVGELSPKPPLREEKGREGKGTESNSCSEVNSEPPVTVLDFPTVGPVATWALTEAQIAKWQGLDPALDVLGECRQAWGWCDANPKKRKTAQGMTAFLNRWLSRAVDSPRQRPSYDPQRKPNQASPVGKRSVVPMGIQDV